MISRYLREGPAFVDGAIAALLAMAVFAVHPLSYALHHPFWLDEAWVASLSLAPLSRAFRLASIAPIGWLLLVRSVPGGRGEQLRLVPLFFSAGDVAAAYVLARCLPWGSKIVARLAAFSVGLIVLLAPFSLVRDDLKQYTADAFFALVVLVLAGRAEGAPSTRTMLELAAGSIVAVFFSTAAAFVVVAAIAGLFLASVAARSTERARTVAVSGVFVGVVVACYFGVAVIPHSNAALRAFWHRFYLPVSLSGLRSETWHRLTAIAPALGVPVLVIVVLFAVGCLVLAQLGRPGMAYALAVLWIEMMVVAMARWYPFLDLRTSHFLLTVVVVTMVIGFVGIVRLLAQHQRLLATSVAMLAAAAYLHASVPYIRARWIPNEDVRSAVAYVADHRRPGDVIVVTLPSTYGFSYYWPGSHVEYLADDDVTMGFASRVRNLRDVVYVDGLSRIDTTSAMRHAIALETATARIFIIRTHLYEAEAEAWRRTFHDLNLHATRVPVGAELMWVIAPRARTRSDPR